MAEKVKKPKDDQTIEAENVSVVTEEVTVTSGKVKGEVVEDELPLIGLSGASTKTTKKVKGAAKPPILQGLVNQPTAMPSNKHMAYTGGILLGWVINAIVSYFFTDVAMPDGFWETFPVFLGWVMGYIVKDQRNA